MRPERTTPAANRVYPIPRKKGSFKLRSVASGKQCFQNSDEVRQALLTQIIAVLDAVTLPEERTPGAFSLVRDEADLAA